MTFSSRVLKAALILGVGAMICVSRATAAGRPANDDFVNRPHLAGVSVQVSGDTTGATLETGERGGTPLAGEGQNSVWWTWTVPDIASTEIFQVAISSDVNTFVDVGLGDSPDLFLRQIIAVAQDSPPIFSVIKKQTAFWVSPGAALQIRVNSGPSNATGKFSLSIGRAPGVTFSQPSQNELFVVPSGGRTNVTVSVDPSSPDAHIASVTIGSQVLTNAPYSIVLTNVAAGTYQVTATATDDIGISSEPVTVTYRIGSAVPNDDFADRAALVRESVRVVARVEGATMQAGEPPIPQNSGLAPSTVWWRWTAPSTAIYDFATTGGQIDIFTGSDLAHLTPAVLADRSGPLGSVQFYHPTYQRVAAVAGTEYAVRVVPNAFQTPLADVALAINRFPALAITSPANGAVFHQTPDHPAVVDFSVAPLPQPRQATRIYFFSNDRNSMFPSDVFPDIGPVFFLSAPPFNVSRSNLLPGNYTWYARAYDELGLAAASDLREIVIKDDTVLNDDFANRAALQGVALQFAAKNLASATFEPGEATAFNSGSLWWTWTASVTGDYGIVLKGSALTGFGVYTGDTLASLSRILEVRPGAYDGNVAGYFNVTAGTTYNFRAVGAHPMTALPASVADQIRIARRPSIAVSAQPNSFIPRRGNIRIDAAAASPDAKIARVDFSENASLLGASTIPPFHLTFTNVPSTRFGVRSIMATAYDEFGLSTKSQITIGVSDEPMNDNFTQRLPLTGAIVQGAGSGLGATAEPGEPGASPSETIWWSWTAPQSGTYEAVLLGDFASRMDIFTGDSLAALTPIAGITNEHPTAIRRNISFAANAGASYQIRLSPYPPNTGQDIPLTFQIRPEGFAPSPSVSIVAPQNEQNFIAGSNIPIVVNAAADYILLDQGFEDQGYIASVEFFANDQSLGRIEAASRNAQFSLNWTNRLPGRFLLKVKATDQTGAFTISDAVPINVNLPPDIQLRLVQISPGVVHFAIVGPTDHTYSVRTSTDLVNWTTIATHLSSTSAVADFTQYNAGWDAAGFYQAVTEP